MRTQLQGSTTVEVPLETSLEDPKKPTRAVDEFDSSQNLTGKRHLQSIVGVADRKEGLSIWQALPPRLETASSPWQHFREWQDKRDNSIMKYLEHL